MDISICDACRKQIRWAKTANGGKIPLDLKSEKHIYTVLTSGGSDYIEKTTEHYVSHFLTCSNPNKFSNRSNQKELF